MSERGPFTDFQIASLSGISGVASSTSKFQRVDAGERRVARVDRRPLRPERDHARLDRVVGARVGLRAKPFHIRVARWSTIVIGGRFSSDSTVATMLAVS